MDAPHLDASLRTHTFATAGELGAAWYRIGAMQSAGLTLTPALAWFDATIAEATAALAEGVRADDPIFVPYLSGERTPFMDPSLRGSWHGLSLATTRSAMLRSVLEAVAQAVSLGVAAVQAAGDRLPDVVPLVGGGTHDPVFRQLLADATGATLAVTEAPDAAVVGAAMLAAGRASAPHAAVMSGEVSPRAAVADLLAHRRETMVALVSPQESA
jgi:sugar (pentulose or hexulose) kinase